MANTQKRTAEQPLEIRLLGRLEVRLQGRDIRFPTRHSGILLAYLALAPMQEHPRDRLAALFWADRPDQSARSSLRQAVYQLKRVLDQVSPNPLVATAQALRLQTDRIWCDVWAFEQAVAGDFDTLNEAFALYHGDLLEAAGDIDPTFDSWLADEQWRVRKLAIGGFFRLAEAQRVKRQFGDMAVTARRLCHLDKFDESHHRLLLTALSLNGQRNAAIAAYRDMEATLNAELGVSPEAETKALIDTIRGDNASKDGASTASAMSPQPQEHVPRARRTQGTSHDRPVIAVLPFRNQSSDKDQDYFVDGITEDITNGLSKFRSLIVIARHSTFEFKGSAAETDEIGRSLGARYIVQGAVRRVGDQLRITASLTDAIGNTELWNDRFDLALPEVFAVQDSVTDAIVGAIEPELLDQERKRIRRKAPQNLTAWDLTQHGLWHLWQQRPGSHEKAITILQQALESDADSAQAHAGLAYALCHAVKEGVRPDREVALDEALAAARQSVRLDPKDAFSYVALGRTSLARREFERAIEAYREAISINGNFVYGHFGTGYALCLSGRATDALPFLDHALLLSPRDPQAWSMATLKSFALTMLERYDEALKWARRAQQMPNAPHWAFVAEAAPLSFLGRSEEAKRARDIALRLKPELTAAFAQDAFPFASGEGSQILAQAMLGTFVPRQTPS